LNLSQTLKGNFFEKTTNFPKKIEILLKKVPDEKFQQKDFSKEKPKNSKDEKFEFMIKEDIE